MPEEKGAMSTGVEDTAEPIDLEQINFVKEALQWQYNWIALAGAGAFAIVSGSALPLILASGLELMYLSLVPQDRRFRRLVRSWKYAEEKRRHEIKLAALYQELPPALRQRYTDLSGICQGIRGNYQRLSSTSQIFVQQMEQKLQELLHSYLRLLYSAYQHGNHLQTASPEVIRKEIAQLQRSLDSSTPKVQEINRKRIEILTKRLEKFEKIRENRQVIDAQCEAIQDVLELIRDQSVTMTDPQQVSDRLENLMRDVEQTEGTVREVEAIFQLAAPELSDTLPVSTPAAPRTRVPN